ncbi:P27 family phage terminase small subunit [Jeotgalibacillus haloalkalitolerans]|uniref:Terminase n=1 Tax=Jeotgalibacillus haloalkalitolerans TaxID=3104292 RepID=A0ABU5KLZ3_9BACL|nr:P27 family phage terminase small subunit [Jeotgalibacillus sp. HH7-29]MDZ5712249.1 hypothetical protein [Jeotgalibacillus sp. HH7-29]
MTKTEIKNDLLEQLRVAGMHGKHYEDMINKYMQFWTLHGKLSTEINKKGIMLPSGTGYKMNPAVEARNKNNTQMLNILKTLGIKAPTGPPGGGDLDDDL